MWRLEKEINSMILKLIKQRQEEGRKKDLLQMLIDAAKNSEGSNGFLSDSASQDRFMIDNCKNIFIAASQRCLMLLATHQVWQDRVRAKVLDVCGNNGNLDASILRSMKTVAKAGAGKLRTTQPLNVTVANGGKMEGNQVCEGIELKMQGLIFNTQAIVIPIAGCDVVLGMQWLRGLGKVFWDCLHLEMEFLKDGQKVKLVAGNPASNKVVPSCRLSKMEVTKGFVFMMQQLKYNLRKAVKRMKTMADRRRTEKEFKNPAGCSTFHVSLLKPCKNPAIPLRQLPVKWGNLQPEKILDRRMVQKGHRSVTEVLIQWQGELTEEATWEVWYELQRKFPEFAKAQHP